MSIPEPCDCNNCPTITSPFIDLGPTHEGFSGVVCFKAFATDDCESNQYCINVVIPPKPNPVVEMLTEYASAFEGDPGMPVTGIIFEVIRNGWIKDRVSTVDWEVIPTGSNPVNKNDFYGNLLPSGTITFNSSEDTKKIEILINGDLQVENNETFAVKLVSASGNMPNAIPTFKNTVGIGEILKDKPKVSFASNTVSYPESEQININVLRNGYVYKNSTVNWKTYPTGSHPIDINDINYENFPSGILEFAPGETSKTISIDTIDDISMEQLYETFAIELFNPIRSELEYPIIATGIIVDNDDYTLTNFIGHEKQDHIFLAEGSTVSGVTTFDFPITRISSSTTKPEVEVSWRLIPTTSPFQIPTPNDFVNNIIPSGKIIIQENSPTGLIQVEVKHDTTVESAEYFSIELTNSTNSTIDEYRKSRIAFIANDDFPPPPNFGESQCPLTSGMILQSYDISEATFVGIYDDGIGRTGRPKNKTLPDNHYENTHPCGAGSHICNAAIFDVILNDYLIGTIDLNNANQEGSPPIPSDPYYDSQMTNPYDRQSSFVIPSLPLDKIPSDGSYTIKLVCKYNWCHNGIIFAKIYDKNGNLVFCECVPNDTLRRIRVFTATKPNN